MYMHVYISIFIIWLYNNSNYLSLINIKVELNTLHDTTFTTLEKLNLQNRVHFWKKKSLMIKFYFEI